MINKTFKSLIFYVLLLILYVITWISEPAQLITSLITGSSFRGSAIPVNPSNFITRDFVRKLRDRLEQIKTFKWKLWKARARITNPLFWTFYAFLWSYGKYVNML